MYVTWLAILSGFDQSLLQLAKMIDVTKFFPGFKWGPLLVNGGIGPLRVVGPWAGYQFFKKIKNKKRKDDWYNCILVNELFLDVV